MNGRGHRAVSERLSGSRGSEKGNQRLTEKVAELIEQDIWESGWNVGSVVGSEWSSMERYGVSRAVFREVARLAEHQRMAAMRRGPVAASSSPNRSRGSSGSTKHSTPSGSCSTVE
nr:GntR family transcriptional regulator [Streptomyces xiaopingdaonensis]